MKKNIKLNYLVSLAFLFIVSIPASVSAAGVYIESSKSTLSVGDTVIVSVKVNSDGAVLNTIDGEVSLKSSNNSFSVKEFSLANSSFGLWPRTPSLSKDNSTISFVAGVPGGFSIEGATLFKIIIEAKKEGSIVISPKNVFAFANDGKGTRIPAKVVKDLTINVVSRQNDVQVNDEWQKIVVSDVLPPEDFIVVLGQDKNLFENKKFAFFSALDNQSGISHYEVSEDNNPFIRSGSTYVLKNQSDDVVLSVTAYDKAGNKKVAKYPASVDERGISWISIIIIVTVIVLVRLTFKKIRRSKKDASTVI